MWHTGLVALWHVRSSWTRAQIRVPRIGRRILNHCATREALGQCFLLRHFGFFFLHCALTAKNLTKKAQKLNEMEGGSGSGSPPQWLNPTKEGIPHVHCSSIQWAFLDTRCQGALCCVRGAQRRSLCSVENHTVLVFSLPFIIQGARSQAFVEVRAWLVGPGAGKFCVLASPASRFPLSGDTVT